MTTTIWEKAQPVREPVGEWIFTPEDGRAPHAATGNEPTGDEEPAGPPNCSIALIGDGTVACEYFPPANRPESHLLVRLRRAFPDQQFLVQNVAAEESAAESLRTGRLDQVFAAVPQVHLAFVRYNIDENHTGGVRAHVNSLQQVGEALRRQYAGITVIFETGIWVHHPSHFTGDSSARLGPMYDQVRGWATEIGYPIVDVFSKMQAEASKGNWDLRVRGLPSREQVVLDDSFDQFFGDEPVYFANIHPNSRCLGLIAEWEVAMIKQLARKG
jgi:hypothetical protein